MIENGKKDNGLVCVKRGNLRVCKYFCIENKVKQYFKAEDNGSIFEFILNEVRSVRKVFGFDEE